FGPGVPRGTRIGRLRVDVQLLHLAAPLADHVAEAVRPGIAAADDHDLATLRSDLRLSDDALSGDAAVLLHQIVHREVNTAQPASGYVHIACAIRADGEHRRVEALAQLSRADVNADVVPGLER